MKYLDFTITETTGRTFFVPMNEVEKLLKENGLEDVDINNKEELAEVLKDNFLDDIARHEKQNDFLEIEVTWAEFEEQ